MTSHDDLAAATLRITCGPSSGSGFFFLAPQVVVTNSHVVRGPGFVPADAVAVTEGGDRLPLQLIGESLAAEKDFAIFQVRGATPPTARVLTATVLSPPRRGVELLFAGFPHGIPHLLVQRALVSGILTADAFYLDGSVNGGNSGGPVVTPRDGRIVGIVTQRRFLGAQDLEALRAAAAQLAQHCQAMAGGGSVQIMGIDFGAFSGSMAQAMVLIQDVIKANANAGIGIAFSIAYVLAKCRELGIK